MFGTKRIMSIVLATLVLTSSTVVVFADNRISQDDAFDKTDIVELANEVVEDVENELEENGTNIIEQLEDMKKYYAKEIKNEVDIEKIGQLEILSEQIDKDIELMRYYEIDKDIKFPTYYSSRNIIDEAKYESTLAACKSYFWYRTYLLSHELISQYQINTSSRKVYKPSNIGGLYKTELIQQLREKQRFEDGYGTFTGNGSGNTRNEKDAHYAINKFSYRQDYYEIVIKDTYDFEYGDKGSYNNFVQSAVNIFAAAERDGYFIALPIEINL